MFNGQEVNVLLSTALAKLGAIGVLFPAHFSQQFPIGRTERDEVAAAPMIGPENQFSRRQFDESTIDIDRAHSRAIPPNSDNFFVAHLRDSLDRVFKARREIPAGLPMNMWTGRGRISRRCEKMNINRR